MGTNDKSLIGYEFELLYNSGQKQKIEIIEKDEGKNLNCASYNSIIGEALLDKKVGDSVVLKDDSFKILNKRNKALEDCIEKHNLTKLYHFTSVNNLTSIFEHGVLSMRQILEKRIKCDMNDLWRIDNHQEYISCSLERPNKRLLWSFSLRNRVDFCYLEISLDVLKKDDKSLCCSTNAAKEAGALIEPITKIEHLFDGDRTDLPNNYPTDSQAEILIYKEIPIKYIKRVIFENNYFINQYKHLVPENMEISHNFKLF